jgi:hypothetical protein
VSVAAQKDRPWQRESASDKRLKSLGLSRRRLWQIASEAQCRHQLVLAELRAARGHRTPVDSAAAQRAREALAANGLLGDRPGAKVLPSEYGRLGYESVTGRTDPLDHTASSEWLDAAVARIVADARCGKRDHRSMIKARNRAAALKRRLDAVTSHMVSQNEIGEFCVAGVRKVAGDQLERFASAAIRAKLVGVYVSPPNPPRLEARGVRFEEPQNTEEAAALAKELVRWWLDGGGVDGKGGP